MKFNEFFEQRLRLNNVRDLPGIEHLPSLAHLIGSFSDSALKINLCSFLNLPILIMSRGVMSPRSGFGVMNHRIVFRSSLKNCATMFSTIAHSLILFSNSLGILGGS